MARPRKTETIEQVDDAIERSIEDRLASVRERLNEISAGRDYDTLSLVARIETRTLAIVEARFMRMLDIIEG